MLMVGADPSLIWGLIHIMQMFYYLLFLNVIYPSNVEAFLGVFKVGRLEFLPNPSALFDFGLETNTIPSPKNFEENEFSGFFGSLVLY